MYSKHILNASPDSIKQAIIMYKYDNMVPRPKTDHKHYHFNHAPFWEVILLSFFKKAAFMVLPPVIIWTHISVEVIGWYV